MANLPSLPNGYAYPTPLEKIGEGGYGTVYKIWNSDKSCFSALKISNKIDDIRATQRFRLEMQTLENIQHPNIVEIEYSNSEDLFFIMEYLDGGTLSFDKKYNFVELLTIFKQIAQGLYFAHRLGLVHRDLKPQNILFDRNNKAKISDFGVVHSSGSGVEITHTTDFLGTPLYMAPEQICDVKNVRHYTDLWALGVIMYKFLTHHFPYGDDQQNAFAVVHSILEHRLIPAVEMYPELNKTIGAKEIAAICEQNLQRDCELRYSDAMAMAVDIDTIIHRISKPIHSPQGIHQENIVVQITSFFEGVTCIESCSLCGSRLQWQDFMNENAFLFSTTRGRTVRWSSCCKTCFQKMPSVVANKPSIKLAEGVVVSYDEEKIKILRECPKTTAEMIQRGERAFCLIEKMPPHNLYIPETYVKLPTMQGESHFMRYDYKPGFYLKQWIKTKSEWDVELISSIAFQILQGLHFLHENGLVYRALTPSSIFISMQGEVLLDNFFLTKSQKTDSLMQTGQTITLEQPLGFLEYMSPEQIANSVSASHACDIWAFGVVCYYLFSGHIPFRGEGSYQMAKAISQEDPPPLSPQVPQNWKDIIQKCLHKDPLKRFHSVIDIYIALTK